MNKLWSTGLATVKYMADMRLLYWKRDPWYDPTFTFLSFNSLSQSVWRRWSVWERAASPSACVGSPIPSRTLSASRWCFVEGGRVWTCAAHRVRRRSAGSGASELSKTAWATWARRRSLINILTLYFQSVAARTSGPRGKVLNHWPAGLNDFLVYVTYSRSRHVLPCQFMKLTLML